MLDFMLYVGIPKIVQTRHMDSDAVLRQNMMADPMHCIPPCMTQSEVDFLLNNKTPEWSESRIVLNKIKVKHT